ncbi:cobalamin B12-binding domain-containing protein [Streptomyces prasinopilosus]|uniref:Methanogenic corrinoid protein MtbC1 n=1 Tax=Streptomyces prasinopilosus TaxID=67344 RepID=A0A1G6M917_9ACTN|nr:cobalamin-dependent protein [Streptomyces prasinopilosus]SDC51435.1 Methanogenic corrinoid protein MtbC1 [Streptomyces prasinopilosus]
MTTVPAPDREHRPGRLLVRARPASPRGDDRVRDHADGLWTAIRAADASSAADLVAGALRAGLAPETVLLDVIGAVQRKVGVEWAANRMSVAEEHAATAVNEHALTALVARRPAPTRGRVTVACVDKEWHALPARFLAEVLRLRGWRVDHLGARVPTAHLISRLHRAGATAVCLSASLSTRLPAAHAAVTAVQATGVPVMVGGLAFGVDGRYARLLGADAWASDARGAADRLAAGPLPAPRPPRQAVDDLPHLADQEYTLVARCARGLVRRTFQGLERRLPPMRDYTAEQLERTAEDLAQIVDFLAAALYVDDADVFTGFLTWTAEVLTTRGVPAHVVPPALDLLEEQLRDFPRARGLVAAGREALGPFVRGRPASAPAP